MNYSGGETIRYPVPLIHGELADAELAEVTIVNTSSTRDTRRIQGVAYKGRFKAFTELVPGENKLVIRAGRDELAMTLTYEPLKTPYVVRCIYLTDKSGATDYQSPIDGDPQDYAAKLDTAMKLLQTFTAERLHDLGFGRRTFRLELDENGKVKVHVFKGREPAEFYYGLDDGAWWGRIAQELEPAFPTPFAKNVAIAAYTRFDPATGKVRGHTALGGGSLALFGSGNLFTWPSRLQDVQAAFMDSRPIDSRKVFSDSVFRHTFWGAASTTLGATLHELAHTFDLPHTREEMDIMTRGFDQFNRAFTFVDPPSASNREAIEFRDDQVACFAPVSAAALVPCRWFSMSEKRFTDGAPATAMLDEAGDNIIVESAAALRYVGFGVNGEAVHHLVPRPETRRSAIAVADVLARTQSPAFDIRIIDDRGQVTLVDGVLRGPFVQAWQFASITEPWQEKSAFVAVDDQRLKEIAASAAGAKLSHSQDRFVDFTRGVPGASGGDVAAYACRTIKSDRARKIRILTGSDDALRVWINGELVTQVLELRPAAIDAESRPAEIRAGENLLMVEVSQAGGGWGLYLRIEDENGTKLRLTNDGELVPATGKR